MSYLFEYVLKKCYNNTNNKFFKKNKNMKKQFKFILGALTLMLISFTSNAQFKKTEKFVEGTVSYSKTTGTERQYSINPTVGYFLTNRFALGVNAGIGENATQRTTSIGVFSRCYFKNTGKLNVFSQLSVSSNKLEVGKSNATTTNTNVGIGANYFVSKKIALTTTLANLVDYNDVGTKSSFTVGFNGVNNPLSTTKFGILYKL
jgi:outer membrane protein